MQFKVTNPDGTEIDFEHLEDIVNYESWAASIFTLENFEWTISDSGELSLKSWRNNVATTYSATPPAGRFLIQFEEQPLEPKLLEFRDQKNGSIAIIRIGFGGPIGYVSDNGYGLMVFEPGEFLIKSEELLEIASYIRHTTNKKGKEE